MAVTCSYKKKYGKLTFTDRFKIDLWTGGNCWLVGTCDWQERRYLQFFISDSKHLKYLSKDATDIWSRYTPKSAMLDKTLPHVWEIAKWLSKCGFEIKIK